MSDAARTTVAALGLWFFFRGLEGSRRRWWLASGLVAGASLTLRESAALPFVPFFAGALLRWDRGWGWLLLGGLAGTALHLAGNCAFGGNAMFVRGTRGYPLALATVPERLPLYLLGLLVLVPGGLWFGLSYRGRRRPEIVATVLLMIFYPRAGLRHDGERLRQASRDRPALLRSAAARAGLRDGGVRAAPARSAAREAPESRALRAPRDRRRRAVARGLAGRGPGRASGSRPLERRPGLRSGRRSPPRSRATPCW